MIAYVIWALGAAGILGAAVWTWLKYQAAAKSWVMVAPGISFNGATDAATLARALSLATDVLKWSPAPLRIFVHDTPTWRDSFGRMVGGETWEGVYAVEVGSDLSALCHELIHLKEGREGKPPSNCLFWPNDGDWRGVADRAYRKALASYQ